MNIKEALFTQLCIYLGNQLASCASRFYLSTEEENPKFYSCRSDSKQIIGVILEPYIAAKPCKTLHSICAKIEQGRCLEIIVPRGGADTCDPPANCRPPMVFPRRLYTEVLAPCTNTEVSRNFPGCPRLIVGHMSAAVLAQRINSSGSDRFQLNKMSRDFRLNHL